MKKYYGIGGVARNPYHARHLIAEWRGATGQVEKHLACNTRHDSWQLMSDEWFDEEYQAADRVLKDPFGCKRCQRLIRKNATNFV